MRKRANCNKGFTLIELLVSLGIFSVFSLGVTSYLTLTFKRMSTESRASLASMELRNAIAMLSSELRMGSSISPYLPGNDTSITTCGANITVTPTTVKFLVTHDDSANSAGIKAYYVGYRYDSATKTLLRGEIASTSTTSCSVPAGDPTAAGTAQVLAENIVQIDSNNDSVLEPAFSFSSPRLTLNLGINVDSYVSSSVQQKVTTVIATRVL